MSNYSFLKSADHDVQVLITVDDGRQARVSDYKTLHQSIQRFVRGNKRFIDKVVKVQVLERNASEPYELPLSAFKIYVEAVI